MALEQKEREGACNDHATKGCPITIFSLHVYICAQTYVHGFGSQIVFSTSTVPKE